MAKEKKEKGKQEWLVWLFGMTSFPVPEKSRHAQGYSVVPHNLAESRVNRGRVRL